MKNAFRSRPAPIVHLEFCVVSKNAQECGKCGVWYIYLYGRTSAWFFIRLEMYFLFFWCCVGEEQKCQNVSSQWKEQTEYWVVRNHKWSKFHSEKGDLRSNYLYLQVQPWILSTEKKVYRTRIPKKPFGRWNYPSEHSFHSPQRLIAR